MGYAQADEQTLWVRTSYRDIDSLCEGFADRVENGSLILYGPDCFEEGSAVLFSIELEDGTAAAEGIGTVVGCVDAGADRSVETRYDVVIHVAQLRGAHASPFQEMLGRELGGSTRGLVAVHEAVAPDARDQGDEPILECRRSYAVRVLLTLILVPGALMFTLGGLEGHLVAWLLVALFVACLALTWISEGKRRVLLFRHRLEAQSLYGTKTVALDPITQYKHSLQSYRLNGIPVGTHCKITVQRGDDRLVVQEVSGVEQLLDLLIQIQLEDVLPHAIACRQEGRPVSFGRLVVQGDRIRFKNKEIALAELGRPRLENGQLKLRVPGKVWAWANVSVAAVPNLDTFLRLIGNDATRVEPGH